MVCLSQKAVLVEYLICTLAQVIGPFLESILFLMNTDALRRITAEAFMLRTGASK